MYRLVLDTSDSAYIYQNLSEDSIRTIGNWDYYFDFEIKDPKDLINIYNYIDLEHAVALKEILHLEKIGLEDDDTIIRLRDEKTWLECRVHVIYDEAKHPTDKIIRLSNITKIKNANDELTYMAYYDTLTGLYNRNYFVRSLGEFLHHAQEKKEIVSVLFINFDDFRRINDSLGIVIGDEIVQQFGQFLADFKSDNVIVSHFNGDSFCLAIYAPYGYCSVETIINAIQDRLKWPFYMSNKQEVSFTVSIGVAEYPEAAQTPLELINCAEVVMVKAKSTGHGSVRYFDVPILNEFLHNAALESKLREAVFNQNFTLHFQPQYYVVGKKLRGFEALIRWRDQDGQMISPYEFIPIAEKNGTIVPIGNWVIDESIAMFAEWRKKYGAALIISLNISAVQYAQADFIENLVAAVKGYGVEPSEVELEITENILINDFKEMIEKLQILREYGFGISLDDFGTGYSSLSYLKGLPITTLKIDKSFIDTVLTDENTRIITESMIAMVKNMGYEVIAEGVETEEQFKYLESIGCAAIQGYYLNKPMPADEIVEKVLKIK
jgi:diguanylate cyclase (GGDEF)-like protein